MRQRAELLKGKLKIHSQPGRGTALLLQIPIEQTAEEEYYGEDKGFDSR